jgi:1,6-anhydro-N-acetylmuramate kinase
MDVAAQVYERTEARVDPHVDVADEARYLRDERRVGHRRRLAVHSAFHTATDADRRDSLPGGEGVGGPAIPRAPPLDRGGTHSCTVRAPSSRFV